jgi:hypothetical protein
MTNLKLSTRPTSTRTSYIFYSKIEDEKEREKGAAKGRLDRVETDRPGRISTACLPATSPTRTSYIFRLFPPLARSPSSHRLSPCILCAASISSSPVPRNSPARGCVGPCGQRIGTGGQPRRHRQNEERQHGKKRGEFDDPALVPWTAFLLAAVPSRFLFGGIIFPANMLRSVASWLLLFRTFGDSICPADLRNFKMLPYLM